MQKKTALGAQFSDKEKLLCILARKTKFFFVLLAKNTASKILILQN